MAFYSVFKSNLMILSENLVKSSWFASQKFCFMYKISRDNDFPVLNYDCYEIPMRSL